MSTTKRIRASRNFQVLLGRFPEENPQAGGCYQAVVCHDPWCAALAVQSMLACWCKPEIIIEEVASGGNH
jgi:hypothetical protein